VLLFAGLGGIITYWLNTEWTPLDAHTELGRSTATSYRKAMNGGIKDMGDLVLTMGPDLMVSADFSETFTGPYDIANKVVELLMLRSGIDVCCTSDDDLSLIANYAEASASS
jgi:hypothetical protein